MSRPIGIFANSTVLGRDVPNPLLNVAVLRLTGGGTRTSNLLPARLQDVAKTSLKNDTTKIMFAHMITNRIRIPVSYVPCVSIPRATFGPICISTMAIDPIGLCVTLRPAVRPFRIKLVSKIIHVCIMALPGASHASLVAIIPIISRGQIYINRAIIRKLGSRYERKRSIISPSGFKPTVSTSWYVISASVLDVKRLMQHGSNWITTFTVLRTIRSLSSNLVHDLFSLSHHRPY